MPTLRDPMDCSLPGSSAHGIFQARVLEWGAIAFSYLSSLDFSKEQFTYFGSTAFALAVTSFWNVELSKVNKTSLGHTASRGQDPG